MMHIACSASPFYGSEFSFKFAFWFLILAPIPLLTFARIPAHSRSRAT